MKILVTGATGFIGSHLIERLIEGGHSVTALIRPTSDSNSFISRGIQTVAGDVADPETVSIAVNEADAVVNLARAKAHGRRPHSALTSVNVEGARNVARAAQRAGAKLVHASSTAVYGSRLENLNADETASLKPDSIYAEPTSTTGSCTGFCPMRGRVGW